MSYTKVMIKKTITTLIVVLFLLPSLTWSYGFFNITDSYIQRLDENSYRFRAWVSWDEDILPAPTNPSLEWASPGLPYFWNFEISASQLPDNCTYNFFVNEYDGDLFPQTDPCWTAVSYRLPGSLGSEFGFDFDLTGFTRNVTDYLDKCQYAFVSFRNDHIVGINGNRWINCQCFLPQILELRSGGDIFKIRVGYFIKFGGVVGIPTVNE